MPKISVVIPVYRSEKTVSELVRRLKSSLEAITRDYEILMVEDCGGDGSWEHIMEESDRDPRVKGIRFSRNFGQHYALTAGLDYAEGDWVVLMDCDMQDHPEDIERLYRKALEGYDNVLARRTSRGDSKFNAFTSRAFYRLFDYLTGTQTEHSVGTFRIVSKKVVNAFRSIREQQRFIGGVLQWMGFSTAYIDVPRSNRHSGESTYTFHKRLDLAISAIVTFSNKPLVLSIKLGFFMAFLSFLYALYLIGQKMFWNIPVPGWTSVMVSLYLLSGLMLIMLGILGLYLGKTFDQTKSRPLYIIDEKTFDE